VNKSDHLPALACPISSSHLKETEGKKLEGKPERTMPKASATSVSIGWLVWNGHWYTGRLKASGEE
jgi:hypothetical protein